MLTVAASRPGAVAALAVGDGELLVANLTGAPVDIAVRGWRPDGVAIPDATSCARPGFDWAAERRPLSPDTLRLPAYAVASLDGPPLPAFTASPP